MILRAVRFEHPDAVQLRAEQVAFSEALYAEDPSAVNRDGSEGIEPASVISTLLAYEQEQPIGHACARRLGGEMAGEVEMKRLFVREASRGRGVADQLLAGIEQAAREAGAARMLIHTGQRQTAALAFYARHGYTPIRVFAPYQGVAYSVCCEKLLP